MKQIIKGYEIKVNTTKEELKIINQKIADIIIDNLQSNTSTFEVLDNEVVMVLINKDFERLTQLQNVKERLIIKQDLFLNFIQKLEGCDRLIEFFKGS